MIQTTRPPTSPPRIREALFGRRVLVLGSGARACQAALDLCLENEVTLACRRDDVTPENPDQGFVLRELGLESEIRLWRSTTLDHLEMTEEGRCRAFFSEGGPEPAEFDVVVCATDRR